MPTGETEGSNKRQYPPLYEKAIPIALGVIAVAILAVLVVALSVLLGVFPGH